jgi:hypothetical protein
VSVGRVLQRVTVNSSVGPCLVLMVQTGTWRNTLVCSPDASALDHAPSVLPESRASERYRSTHNNSGVPFFLRLSLFLSLSLCGDVDHYKEERRRICCVVAAKEKREAEVVKGNRVVNNLARWP